MIHRFIFLNDSLTRATLQTSAGMIEKEYFRERTAFADYRMRSRRIGEAAAAVILLLVVAAGVLLVRQRMRLQRERYERELLLAGEVREKYRELVRQTEQTLHAENRMKGILATRFDIVDRLGKTLYERENTASGQAAMTRQVKRLIDGFAADGEMLPELERIVDIVHDNAMRKLRRDFPGMKQADIRLLCYIFGGFSPQVITTASPTSTPASRGSRHASATPNRPSGSFSSHCSSRSQTPVRNRTQSNLQHTDFQIEFLTSVRSRAAKENPGTARPI